MIGKEFKDLKSGMMYMNAVARHQGYGISIKSAKTEDHQKVRVYYRCSLGRQVNSVAKERKSSTKMTNCPFEISINYLSTIDRWVVKQDLKNEDKHKHNHEPFDQPNHLSKNRQFSEEALRQMDLLASAGCRLAQIRALMNFAPGSEPLVRDIRNALYRQRDRWLAGRTPIQGLFDLISDAKWAYRTTTSAEGTLQSLFIASPEAIEIARRFPTVIGLDCTYKTNRFQLPLLHIVGTTNTHQTFTIALCFMHSEVEERYVWALEQLKSVVFEGDTENTNIQQPQTFCTDAEPALYNAIAKVFPSSCHLLCIWHINHNIGKNCKKKFKGPEFTQFMKLWNRFMQSTTQEDYDTNLEAVTTMARRHHILEYLEKTWLNRTQKFVALFTAHQAPHFGNSSTSRVEGGHYRLKRFLDGGNNDFITCFKAFKRAGDLQYQEITISTGVESQKTLQGLPNCFQELDRQITHFALNKMKNQYDLIAESFKRPCTQSYRGAWGLPCSHEVARSLEIADNLSRVLVHPQWHSSLVAPPGCHEDLKKAVRSKLDQLLELPEHSLRKIYEELSKLETGRYSLIPIQNASVKTNNRGRPRNDLKRPGSSQKEGRWKSNFELEEIEEAKEAEKEATRAAKKARVSTAKGTSSQSQNQDSQQPKASTSKLKASHNSKVSTISKVPAVKPNSFKCSTCKVAGHRSNYCPTLKNLPAPIPLEEPAPQSPTSVVSVTSSPSDHESHSDVSMLDAQENDDANECIYCEEPYPSEPSNKLLAMKAILDAMPDAIVSHVFFEESMIRLADW